MMSRRPLDLRGVALLSAVFFAFCVTAAAQPRRLSIDAIYDPATRVRFSGNVTTGFAWTTGSRYVWPRSLAVGAGVQWVVVDAAAGSTAQLFDAALFQAALEKTAGVAADDARAMARARQYEFNHGFSGAVLSIAGDLHYYAFGSDKTVRLTFEPGEEELATFSPDDRQVAFVRGSDLFVVDVATGREHAVTSTGSSTLLNGKLDWLYQEEIYGRGQFSGFWWSPDSMSLAFLQLDESRVDEFTIVDHIPSPLGVETWRYPKAGTPNPMVRLAVVPASGGEIVWMDLSSYAPEDLLLVDVAWTRDSRSIAFQAQNREQTWLDLNLAHPGTGLSRRILRETTKAWVEPLGSPRWLSDGTFLWFSERTGWKHLYHYTPDGTLIGASTSGRWEVGDLLGVDEAAKRLYFTGAERSPIGKDVYRTRIDGTHLERISTVDGTHNVAMDPALAFYIDTWSDIATPPQVRLHRADGGLVKVLDANPVPALAEFRLSKPELLQVPTRDGFQMEAMMIKPPDFDPSRRYPVFQHTYGGPHAPEVTNEWGGSSYMFHQLLADRGVIVWICDNRSASGKGAESAWTVYRNFGEGELRDVEDGVTWLKSQPYVDGARIGLSGWSYGGFLTSYALTHSTSFVMGIAGGSVTDWRDYDTVYTERLMGLPRNNPEGYRRSAPRLAAANLHGKLLLMHGMVDDNVHMQNTVRFVYELQKAGKPFELMLYPKSRHGVTEPLLVKHLRQTMLDFAVRHLLDGASPVGTGARN